MATKYTRRARPRSYIRRCETAHMSELDTFIGVAAFLAVLVVIGTGYYYHKKDQRNWQLAKMRHKHLYPEPQAYQQQQAQPHGDRAYGSAHAQQQEAPHAAPQRQHERVEHFWSDGHGPNGIHETNNQVHPYAAQPGSNTNSVHSSSTIQASSHLPHLSVTNSHASNSLPHNWAHLPGYEHIDGHSQYNRNWRNLLQYSHIPGNIHYTGLPHITIPNTPNIPAMSRPHFQTSHLPRTY